MNWNEGIQKLYPTSSGTTECLKYPLAGGTTEPPNRRVESLIADVMHLRNEVDCRIEHGAQHGGHLDYVKLCLTQIIDAHR